MNDEAIERYLRSNAALHEAVGARDGAALKLQRLGAGEHNLNYTFEVPGSGRTFVLRVNVATQPFHNDQVAYEHAALAALEPSGRAPKPLFLDNSANAPGKGALVISFCEGEELDFDNLRPGDLDCAAQLMADVHAAPVADDCLLHRPADPLRELYGECVQRYEAYRSSAYEDARITAWTERFMAQARHAMEATRAPQGETHIVNTETLPSHFLIPASSAVAAAASGGARIADPGSIVDWERPIIGEVAQDVAYFVSSTTTFWDSEHLFPARDVGAFVERYWRAVDGRFERNSFDERFGAWRMMTALRSVTWCCKALTVYHAGSDAHTTDKTARKLPVYLSDGFMERLAAECFVL